ncbi:MAG: ATP-binding cassette domain-containing protein, partial [Rubrobacteraceae bacterium]
MAEVTLEDMTKVFGEDVVAVNKMSLDIPDGEFVVFVGPSGCGKSTALRMIAGLEDISSGKVFIGDNVVNDLPPRER